MLIPHVLMLLKICSQLLMEQRANILTSFKGPYAHGSQFFDLPSLADGWECIVE